MKDIDLGIGQSRDIAATVSNYPAYKYGANYSDINKIRGYVKNGLDAFQMAHLLKIDEQVIKNHTPKKKSEPKPKE